MACSEWLTVLAEAGGDEPPAWITWLPLIVIGVLAIQLLIMPQRKEQQKREAMLSGLKKNDRVVTIGGIIGTIANISPDGKEFTLKVDDNTRIKFTRSAISQVLAETTGAKDEPTK